MSGLVVVVLAGGGRDDACRDDADAVNKAFLRIGGSALVTRVLHALREAGRVGRIRVVVPPGAPDAALRLADERRDAGPRIGDSLRAGLEGLPPDDLALVCAADLPLLSADGVDHFATQAVESLADLCYGYLERMRHEARYPTVAHTWARLRDGVFCGTGLCALRPRALPALEALTGRLAAGRKAPWRLAQVLGPGTLLRYALGLLSVAQAEARASALLGAPARGILVTHPELALNVDRYDDVRRVDALLRPGPRERR